MRTCIRTVVGASLVGAMAASTTPAAAADPSVSECLTASNSSVQLRRDHKLRAARAQLLVCISAACPAEVREECGRRLAPLASAIPRTVFEVKDAAGRELSTVKITMDGEPLIDHLDGMAVAVDPGNHELTFSAAGQPSITQTILFHEGEQDRRVSVVLGAAAPTAPGPPLASNAPAPEPTGDDPGHGRRILGIVVGSMGVAGLAVGGIFGGLTFASWGSANSACPSHQGCSAAALNDRSNAVTYGTVSDIGFIAGGVLLAGGLALYLTAPSSQAVGLQVSPGGLTIAGRF
jgi:hypothetical protein